MLKGKISEKFYDTKQKRKYVWRAFTIAWQFSRIVLHAHYYYSL